MQMTSRLSKAVLTSHISFSVGWLGAVVVFLVLAITGLTSSDMQLTRASLISMDLAAWFVIVPFCLLSLLTGIIQAVGTKWGLFKHYWIVVKLILTVASTLLLLLHLQPISYLANAARSANFTNTIYTEEIINLISKTGAAILALVFITTISIYKPWGKIPRNQVNINNQVNMPGKRKSPSFYILMGLLIVIAIVIIKHLLEGGMRHH
jgi:hypothetical protein